jgi:hypothetical protein
MTFKGNQKKIITICEDCKELLRELDARYTLQNKRLCEKCFVKWLGFDNSYINKHDD